MKNELLSIGETSKLKNVSIKSLRYYERIGIFKPAFVDPNSGYRYYSPNQMIDLDVIITCIELGIPLKSLATFQQPDGSLNLKKLLVTGRNTALQNLKRAKASLVQIDSYLEEASQQEYFSKQKAPYRRSLPKRQAFTKQWTEKGFNLKTYTKAMTQLYASAQEAEAVPLYFQGFTVRNEQGPFEAEVYVEVKNEETVTPEAPTILRELPAATYSGFRIKGTSMSACMEEALSYAHAATGQYLITEVWDNELPTDTYVVELLRRIQ